VPAQPARQTVPGPAHPPFRNSAPDPAGFRAFAERYRARYGAEPPRPAALAYDAVAVIAALVKTQAVHNALISLASMRTAAKIQDEAFGTLDRATLKLLDGLARRRRVIIAPNSMPPGHDRDRRH
jgi:ABC-type branched-subunit amino acid transport system substrate-binding protein